MNKLFQAYHHQAQTIAKQYQNAEAKMIDILQKIDQFKIFRELGHSSLFQYALKELNLSENIAYVFINVARKAKEVPALKEEIQEGNLSVHKARRIVPVITKNNSSQWLEMAKTLPQRKIEKAIAKASPKTASKEEARYVSESRLQVSFGLDEKDMEVVKRLRDVLSQKKKRPVSLEEALMFSVWDCLERHDPIKKAQRAMTKKIKNQSPRQGLVQKDKGLLPKDLLGTCQVGVLKRKPIGAQVKHGVLLRDNGQCCYINNKGERCEQRRWLDFHHLQHVNHGGLNSPENLQMLCFNHHKIMHLKN